MKHELTIERGGRAEMGWLQNKCSCGWTGKKHYAYNDYQHTNAREEAARHLREPSTPNID